MTGQIKLALGLAIAALLFGSGCYVGAKWVTADWNAERLATAKESAKKAKKDADKILELETTKNDNLTRIDGLLANNHALWLRLPKTACGQPTNPPIGTGTTPAGGTLHTEPPDPLEEYSREVGELFGQCDKVIENCRVSMEYLQSLKRYGGVCG